MTEPRILTQSELSAFARCPRKWWLGWYRALWKKRYEGSAPVTIGSLVHYGLQAYYQPGGGKNPLDAVRDLALQLLAQYPDATNDILDACERAGIMLEGYMEWVEAEGKDADLEVYAAERKVEVALIGPYRLRGKIDAAALRKLDNLRVQLEHKAVGNLMDRPKTAQSDFQMLTYDLLAFLAALEEGDDTIRTDGLILNLLKRVKRTKAANPPFYYRHEVRHNKQELRNHWYEVLSLAKDMDAARDRLDAGEDHHKVVPKRWRRECSYDCPFFAVCPLLDDGSNAEGMIEQLYEPHDPLQRYNDDAEED